MAKAKEDENVTEMPILVKADVQGSAEAIVQAMEKIGNEEVRVRVLHYGVGAITDTDVGLAEASGAPVMGFNVRANASARNSANQKGVEIRYYSIIYDLVDDVKAAASGLLSAEIRENFIGYSQIKEVLKYQESEKLLDALLRKGLQEEVLEFVCFVTMWLFMKVHLKHSKGSKMKFQKFNLGKSVAWLLRIMRIYALTT